MSELQDDGQRDRRTFLRDASAAVTGLTLAHSFNSLSARAAFEDPHNVSAGYGELHPVKDEATGLPLLRLPTGFRYVSYGWTGDPLADETPTPGAHDGMAVIGSNGDCVTLCRNHEMNGGGNPFGAATITYDNRGRAGCTNLEFDTRQGTWLNAASSLSGTVRNCAGGPTPWGSWLSCEETVSGAAEKDKFEQDHGWIFEVPADGKSTAVPLKAMGRFVHEAVAVDPKTSIVYETEDRDPAGFYRFLPNEKRKLTKGGRLQMMKIDGAPNLSGAVKDGSTFDVEWVDIDEPTRAHSPETDNEHGVYAQGKQQGATTFARLEGCWYGSGRIYFDSTSGGKARKGQIWEYDPAEEKLRLIFESPGGEVLDMPDNLCVSPRGGGLVLCEDGKAVPQRLHGLTADGKLFTFAENNIVLKGEKNGIRGDFRGKEWCGATFSPDGTWLFVNIQTPGITFAITGPWKEGPL